MKRIVRGRTARLLAAAGVAIVLPLLLSACGTVSKAECQTGDWYAIGVNDGRAGAAPSLFDQHAESCRRYSLPADRTAWTEGRAEGLKAYCTPVSGYANGVAGRAYQNVCTGRAGEEFLTAYGLGSEVKRARSRADSAAAALRRLETEMDRTEREIQERRRELASAEGEARRALREELDRLEFRRIDLRADRFDAEREVRAAEREADYVDAEARARFVDYFGYPPA